MIRKTLVPEILPTPTASSGQALRDRVVRHVKRVLAKGAVTGTAALAGCAPGFPLGDNDGGQDAGYAVVDPLPPPCSTYDPAVGATGSAVVDRDAGTVSVRVFTLAGYPWRLDQPMISNVVGAKLEGRPGSGSSESEFIALFGPFAGVTTFSFEAALSCNDYRGAPTTEALLVTVTLSSPRWRHVRCRRDLGDRRSHKGQSRRRHAMTEQRKPGSGAGLSRPSLRSRVLRHTQRLLKTSAIAGTAVLANCSDTGSIAARRSDAGGDGRVDGGLADGGVDAGIPDSGYDAGYVVVDPMPPPANCNDDPLTPLHGSAARLENGHLRVVLSEWQFASWQLTANVDQLVSASLVGTPELSGTSQLTATLQPESEASEVAFQVALSCDDGLDHLPSSAVLQVHIQLADTDGGTSPLVELTLVTPRDQ